MLLSVRSTVTSIGSGYDFKGLRLGLMFLAGMGMGSVVVSPAEVRVATECLTGWINVPSRSAESSSGMDAVMSNGVLVVATETGAEFVGGVAVVVVSGVSVGAAVPVDDVEIAGVGEPATTGFKVAVVSW